MSIFEAEQIRPLARTEGVLAEQVDGDLVIYDEATQMAHCLSRDAASVWSHCDGRATAEDIASSLEISSGTVEQAVAELRDAGLLIEVPGHTRRDVAKRFAVVGGAALAGPALLTSMPVPAAAAACSRPACTIAPVAFTDWNPVPAGDFVWFNSNFTPNFTPDASTVIRIDGVISIRGQSGTVYNLTVPPIRITFGGVKASLSFGTLNGFTGWLETIPISCKGAGPFAGGLLWKTPELIDASGGGGGKSWSWGITVTMAGTNGGFSWQFGAGAYNSLPAGDTVIDAQTYNDAQVKPTTSTSCDNFSNGDQAGTPEAMKSFLISGGSGGGGANFTGSNSSTQGCTPTC
jgi:hypothetical protein